MKLISLFLAFAILSLGGCSAAKIATQPVDMTALSQAAFDARTAYAIARAAANEYADIPRCGPPGAPPICSDQNLIFALRRYDNTANQATLAAERIVRTSGASTTAIQLAINTATEAVRAYKAAADAAKEKVKP